MPSIAALVSVLIYLIAAGLIYWLLTWALSQLPIPEPFATVIRVILVVIVVLIVLYALLSILPGLPHPLLR